MSKVVFYARPGAVRDVEQKAVLAAAGFEVEARDLTAEHWTSASLRAFFDERPIVEWFDPAEPRVVSGEIDPGKLNAQEALVTLALDPRLINGPLVRYDGNCAAGLDTEQLCEFMDIARPSRQDQRRCGACREPGAKPAREIELPSRLLLDESLFDDISGGIAARALAKTAILEHFDQIAQQAGAAADHHAVLGRVERRLADVGEQSCRISIRSVARP